MTDSDKYFIDTNVLLYATIESLGFFKKANNVLLEYENLYFSKQVILEYINNMTSNKIIKNIKYNEMFESIRKFNKIIDIYNR